jgi:hypothetical protein
MCKIEKLKIRLDGYFVSLQTRKRQGLKAKSTYFEHARYESQMQINKVL